MKKLLLSLILTQASVFAAGELPENKTTVPPPIMFEWETLSTIFPQVKIERIFDAYRNEWIEYLVPIEEEDKK